MNVRQYAFLVSLPMSEVQPRERFWGMPKRGIALILANTMFWQPLLVQAEGIIVSAPGTTLGQAGNGVPIVNIAAPNASGLSHNQFNDYNVGANGVILNNATERTPTTQLGGIIVGNPNFNGSAANTIVNEVNGGRPSQLRGYTEVAGQSARVIVANPYGVTCNGCGFINTPQVTLTTGKPVLGNGRVDHYQVDGGYVTVEGAGLNADNVDRFDIITRSAKINAEIHAKQLNVIAGRNDVDAQSLTARARSASPTDAPALSIDSTALGGMYAGAIKLVGTEAGVGVKLAGNLAASAGDVQLDANGQLSLAQTAASGAVSIKAASLDAQGSVYAGTRINMQASGDVTNRQSLTARDSISLSSGGKLTNLGVIEAGVNPDLSRNKSGDVSLTAQNLRNSGNVVASRNLRVQAVQSLDNKGGTLSAQQKTQVTAITLDNRNKGQVLSGGDLALSADQLLNSQGGLVGSNGALEARLGTLDNRQGQVLSDTRLKLDIVGATDNQGGTLGAGQALLFNAASLDNRQAGSLVSDGQLNVQVTGQFDNQDQGEVIAKGAIDLHTGSLDNRGGRLSGKDQLTVHADSVDNRTGVIRADKALQLSVTQMDNRDKGQLSSKAALNFRGKGLNNQGGLVTAVGPLHLEAEAVSNDAGRIASQSDLVATLASLTQPGGELVAQGQLRLTAKQFDNRNGGLIGASKALTLAVDEVDNRGGEISSQTQVNLTGKHLDNSDGGKVLAGTDLELKIARLINQNRGLLFSKGALNLIGERLDNASGTLASQQNLAMMLDGHLDNGAGLLSSEGALTVTTGSMDNSAGSLSSADALQVTSSGSLINRGGTLSTDMGLTLHSASLDNSQNGVLTGQGATAIITGTFNNSQGGRLTSADTLELTAQQVTNRDAGRIASAKALTANVTGLDQQGGELFSNNALTLDLNHGQLNNQGGLINAAGPLVFKNLNGVANQGGEISSAQAFALAATELDNSAGKLLSTQGLTLRVDQALSNVKGLIASAALQAKVGSLNNTEGLISSRGGLDLTVDGHFVNQAGTLIADGGLLLSVDSLDNSSGQIAGKQDVTANVNTLNNQNGQLIAEGNLELVGGTLDNRHDGLVGATKALKLNVGSIDNRTGELSSNGDISLIAQELNNSDAGQVLAEGSLTLTLDRAFNRAKGLLSGKAGLTLEGRGPLSRVDNVGGELVTQHDLRVDLKGGVDNSQGLLSSEDTLTVKASALTNTQGSLSSAGALTIDTTGAILNQGGELVSDANLKLTSSSLDNSQQGNISGKGPVVLTTGDFDNSQSGRLTSGDTLHLAAAQLNNRDGGRIGSAKALTASVTGLDQQKGELFSNTSIDLDLNNGQLNNQGGLINSPGQLLLRNLNGVANQGGEISSAMAFTLAATTLDNSGAKLLSNQALSLRIAQALNNIKGQIAAASLDVHAGTLDNSNGVLASRGDLGLAIDGQLINRSLGLINSQAGLTITADSLDTSNDGEVSAKGDMLLNLNALTQHGGRLMGDAALAIDLGTAGDLDNQNGLITAKGPLSISHLRDLNNQDGEISSDQSFSLTGRTLDNSRGKLISSQQLGLNGSNLLNNKGLISGWQGLAVSGGSLDNRDNGTLSSRSGNLGVDLSGGLLNSDAGALASQGTLDVKAAFLDNSNKGILTSAGAQSLNLAGGSLNNSEGGLIDSGAGLALQASVLTNTGGAINAQQAVTFSGGNLNNSGGSLVGNGAVILDLAGTLDNTNGKLASAGPLLIQHAAQINNQGGQLASQSWLTVLAGGLDNRNRGTVAAKEQLSLTATGVVQNNSDGLIYSQNAGLQLKAARLDNAKGAIQSKTDLTLETSGDIDNQSGRIIAQDGDVGLVAASLDNRGGVLASIRGALEARVTGVLRNGYDLNNNHQGGTVQAQRLTLQALAGIDNNGGRLAAENGDALITTSDFDNRDGGLYAKGLVSVGARNLDNSGTNHGQIAGNRVGLSLSGALNNRRGIIESDSTLAISAASLDNQTGQLRALGTTASTVFQIGGLFDNRNGTLETANNDLTLSAGNFLNTSGKLLHLGKGTFDISMPNVTGAGGEIVTLGGLTLNANSWTNSSVIQAGRLTVNVNNFSQTGTGQLLASTSFTGTGGNWNNNGLIASDGSFDLRLMGGYSGNGRASSLGNMTFDASSINLSTAASIAGGGITSVGGRGGLSTLNNYGRLSSADALNVSAGALNNYGTLASAAKLQINATTLLNDAGALIFSGGDMAIRANSITNKLSDIYSLGRIGIARDVNGARSAVLENISGVIESARDFSIKADAIVNGRANFSVASELYSSAIGIRCYNCDSPGTRYTGEKDSHFVWAQKYRSIVVADENSKAGSLFSGGNLDVQGGSFKNHNSTVGAVKDISISVANFENAGSALGDYVDLKYLDYATHSVDVFEGLIEYNRYNDAEYNKDFHFWTTTGQESMVAPEAYTCCGPPREHSVFQRFGTITLNFGAGYDIKRTLELGDSLYSSGLRTEAPAVIKNASVFAEQRVVAAGTSFVPAVIQAGGNVTINASNKISNGVERSWAAPVSANTRNASTATTGTGAPTVIQIKQQLPPDLAQRQVNPLALPGFSLPGGQNGLFRLSDKGATQALQADAGSQGWTMGGAGISLAQREQPVPVTQGRTIQLGDSAQIATSTRQLAEGVRQVADIDASASPIQVAAPGTDLPPASGPFTGVPLRATQSVASQTIARVQGLPDSKGQSKPHKYLIETNPVLTNLKQFMSSDYLLEGLGYDPDQSWKRLGDGFYEQRLIQQAVVARTGQRFIDGQTSDEALFKYLMNNAIASKQQLDLAVGVTLTAEQVAALTHDIVWLEEHQVNGEKVLVPVLYLAQANNRLAPNGALIQGNDVSLIAGQGLNNSGTLRASNDLAAVAGNNLINSGLIEAGNRLDLLAGNDLVNTAGGIIKGRDVSLTTLSGDVINERSVTGFDFSHEGKSQHRDYLDSASRIEATHDLTIDAGRDFSSIGSVMQSGRDTEIHAGRDINISSLRERSSDTYGSRYLNEQITQQGSSLSAGRDMVMDAGRDLTAIASQIDAKRDIAMAATENLTLASGADEEHFYSKTKEVKRQEDHVSQVATAINAGGDVVMTAGNDMALISSRVSAGDEAYLVAGNNLELLAAQDSDYSLYDMKKKGGWGSKQTQRDEVTQVTNVGSEIKAGGDLTLVSGGDQRYQVAKLESGQDLTLESGGSITFEGVKDLHQESHEKSKSDLTWNSAKGIGSTDETLRQTEMFAQGQLAIRAAGKVTIDVKEINQQTVSQAIDAMLEAEPQLAWIKQAQANGQVDWRLVKEVHDSWKYENSGLGAAPALIIAIVASMVIGPLSGAVVSNFVVGTINGGGDIGAGFKAATSSDAIKGYATQWATGYALNGLDSYVSGWQTNGALILNGNGINNPGYSSSLLDWNTVSQNVLRSGAHVLVSGGINTAINGGSLKDNLGTALVSEGLDLAAAFGNKQVGDLAEYLKVDPGTASKILMHALLGGALSAAKGGDFTTGALAGAAAEGLTQGTTAALGKYLDARFATDDQFKVGAAQIIGILAGSLGGGDPATGSWIAGNAERYNQQVHRDAAAHLAKGFAALHDQGRFVDLQPEDVLEDLQKIADGEKDASKLNPGTVEFLNQFSPEDLRAIFFEPTDTERWVGLGIDLFFPSASGKVKAAATITGPVNKGILEALEKKFGAALAEKAAKATGKVVAQYGPMNQGPLPKGIADTFRSGTYSEIVTRQPTTLYRVYGGTAQELGGYWTKTPPAGPVQSIVDSALNPQWGNTATKVVKIEVPTGTKYFEGVAAPQGGLVGGGNQVLFPKDFKVDSSWIK